MTKTKEIEQLKAKLDAIRQLAERMEQYGAISPVLSGRIREIVEYERGLPKLTQKQVDGLLRPHTFTSRS